MNKNKTAGIVYLVGAGPGDPDLITMKGYNALSKCDTVIYDALVNKELLKLAPGSARKIFVGETRSEKRFTQDEINEIMIYEAAAGNKVVRLKGGDPFVFGRGSEEAIALNNAGIDWEIVPGISSGMAVPAYNGIPLTHRGVSSSVAFVTGHECLGKRKLLDISKVANSVDTIVIFMGSKNLTAIAGKLLTSGKHKTTPVAIIENGTRVNQSTTISTLGEIKFLKENFRSPALIVIGKVVNLRNILIRSQSEFPGIGKNVEHAEVEDEVLS